MNLALDEIVTKIAHQKASMIDRHLAIFLTEQGFKTDEWNVEAMKKQLAEKGLEISHEVTFYSESEVHTFKICRVLAQTSLNIPKPLVLVKEEPQTFPQSGDKFYFIRSRGYVTESTWTGSLRQRQLKEYGNVFKTEAEAEEALEKIKGVFNK